MKRILGRRPTPGKKSEKKKYLVMSEQQVHAMLVEKFKSGKNFAQFILGLHENLLSVVVGICSEEGNVYRLKRVSMTRDYTRHVARNTQHATHNTQHATTTKTKKKTKVKRKIAI